MNRGTSIKKQENIWNIGFVVHLMGKVGVSQSKNDDRQYRFARYSIVLGSLSGVFGFLTAIPGVVLGHVFLTSHKKKMY